MNAITMPSSRAYTVIDHTYDVVVVGAGNAVNLEDQMLKVSANQMDYAAASSLYSRSLGLIKTAIGKR